MIEAKYGKNFMIRRGGIMNKCIKIMWHVPDQQVESIPLTTIQRTADALSVEGILCVKSPQLFEIMAVGEKQAVDRFLDEVYQIVENAQNFGELEIVAATKERDYRGIFRIMI